MVRQTRSEWKADYFQRLNKHLGECEKCFIVNVDNVRSKQLQQIRIALRGTAEVVMGKNTMMKKVISGQVAQNSALEKIVPHIKENVGFVFTKSDLGVVRDILQDNRVAAPAKAGTIAPCDVQVPAQNTGLGPEKTNFFQALQIPTKITRGTIEIINDLTLIKKDSKVGMSEATLLSMLKIYPFSYGLVIKQIYDRGSIYDPAVLDITPEMILEKFAMGVRNLAAVSLASGYTTLASVPHLLAKGFKNLVAISVASDYTFEESAEIKEFLADPSKFASAVAAAAPASAPAAKAAESKPAAEEEEESDDDMGFSLFD